MVSTTDERLRRSGCIYSGWFEQSHRYEPGEALDALEGNDVLALDGLEAIAGNREDEVALFDFHNRARSAGLNVLYSAREIPDALGLCLPDLRSRLSQCARLVLPTMEDARLAALVQDLAAEGAGVVGVERQTKNLEEIFLSLTNTQTGKEMG